MATCEVTVYVRTTGSKVITGRLQVRRLTVVTQDRTWSARLVYSSRAGQVRDGSGSGLACEDLGQTLRRADGHLVLVGRGLRRGPERGQGAPDLVAQSSQPATVEA
jgi:hypothetical protein